MASNIRFIDNVKVGAYKTFGSGGSSGTGSLDIQNNVNNFVLTATGTDTINGEAKLQFNGTSLGVGGASDGAILQVSDGTGADLMLIKNTSDQGIKVTGTGVLQLIEFGSLPSAVEGGVVYHSDNVYVGL